MELSSLPRQRQQHSLVELVPPVMGAATPVPSNGLTKSPGRSVGTTAVVAAAVLALFLKLAIAYNTLGTNDSVTFYAFARSLSDHGLKWTYERGVEWLPKGPIFNHPPMTASFLEFIRSLSQSEAVQANGFSFPFLLRLPGIIADLIVVLVTIAICRRHQLQINPWFIGVLALSPVSLMVSGYHGNTDSVMVMFLFLAGVSCMTNRPWLCGLLFALSCQVKIIPLLFLPVFFCFWLHRRSVVAFLLPLIGASIVMWWEPLIGFPALFVKNVLSYGSYWGLWGITYWLRSTGADIFSSTWLNFSTFQTLLATTLKLLIVGGLCLIAWRRRMVNERGLLESIALGWIVFFVFSPGVCAQYLVWPAPFLLFLSRRLFVVVTATSALFLFFFYNTISHGLPWYVGVSTNQLVSQWAPWAVWPWAAFIAALIVRWRSIYTPAGVDLPNDLPER